MQIEMVNEAKVFKQPEQLRGYLWTVAAGWLVMVIAGLGYARIKGIAWGTAVPIIAAFLLELPLYLAPFFVSVREAAARLERWKFAAVLSVTAVLPYLAYSIPTGLFDAMDLYRVGGLAVSLSFWYIVVPGAIWSDLLFLLAPAAVMISRILKTIYDTPIPGTRIDILGHLMLIHVAALAVLVLRGLPGIEPGLIPTRREAVIGVRSFLFFLPLAVGLLYCFKITARPQPLSPLLAPPIFAGIFLVTAFSEEFAMRGVLQQHLERLLGPTAGLLLASVVFGLVHLNFRTFPNWPMVALAGSAGIFYGLAYHQAKSIRASMITHALTVTLWMLFFK